MSSATMRAPHSLKQHLAERGIARTGDLQKDWEALYRARPDLFSPMIEPVSLPTEAGVLGVLYGIAHGEITRMEFSKAERQEFDRAIAFLRPLIGIPLPPVAIHLWKAGSVCAEAMSSHAFSCAAEPQLRRLILFCAKAREDADATHLARVLAHEVHHAAMATIADPPAGTYLQPMVAALDEIAAGFTDLSVLSALRHDRIASRSFFEEDAEREGDHRERRWLRAALNLTPGLGTQDLCRQLTQIAIAALTHGRDDEILIEMLNRHAAEPLSMEQWQEILRD